MDINAHSNDPPPPNCLSNEFSYISLKQTQQQPNINSNSNQSNDDTNNNNNKNNISNDKENNENKEKEEKEQKVEKRKIQKQQYNTAIKKAKELEVNSSYLPALKSYIEASNIFKELYNKDSAKLNTRIERCKDDCYDNQLHTHSDATMVIDDEWYFNMVTDNYHTLACEDSLLPQKEFVLPQDTFELLYDYQKEAILWFWKLHQQNIGGILGDDMGLGKTVQMSAFLNGAFLSGLIKCVLLILPISVMDHWMKELAKWCYINKRIRKYHSSVSPKRRAIDLQTVAKKGGILITTYGMALKNKDNLDISQYNKAGWDYMILDEGHKIKNHLIGTSKAVRSIPVRNCNKMILSGTFLQNKLSELWSLFDFISEGQLLGSYRDFNSEFAKKIDLGRTKFASSVQKQVSVKLTELLKKTIAPYLLRRTKQEMRSRNKLALEKENEEIEFNKLNPNYENENENNKKNAKQKKKVKKMDFNCNKREIVVWVKMAECQVNLYRKFLDTDVVKTILNTSKSPLAALTVLKKICDHPFLLSDRMANCADLGELSQLSKDQSVSNIVKCGTKMSVLQGLLTHLISSKHRILLFSQSKKLLNMITLMVRQHGFTFLRMDGDTDIQIRQKYVDTYNANPSINVFLLTTKVGGLGLNLTGADRVIIYDPAWNPSHDAQAVDRAYRIGQKKDVMVYRLVTCGAIEEKIYRRQISKVGLLKTVTESTNQHRYFSKDELRNVFKLEDPNASATQDQFKSLHQHRIGRHAEFDLEAENVEYMDHVFGLSHHDLLFKTVPTDELNENPELAAHIESVRERFCELPSSDVRKKQREQELNQKKDIQKWIQRPSVEASDKQTKLDRFFRKNENENQENQENEGNDQDLSFQWRSEKNQSNSPSKSSLHRSSESQPMDVDDDDDDGRRPLEAPNPFKDDNNIIDLTTNPYIDKELVVQLNGEMSEKNNNSKNNKNFGSLNWSIISAISGDQATSMHSSMDFAVALEQGCSQQNSFVEACKDNTNSISFNNNKASSNNESDADDIDFGSFMKKPRKKRGLKQQRSDFISSLNSSKQFETENNAVVQTPKSQLFSLDRRESLKPINEPETKQMDLADSMQILRTQTKKMRRKSLANLQEFVHCEDKGNDDGNGNNNINKHDEYKSFDSQATISEDESEQPVLKKYVLCVSPSEYLYKILNDGKTWHVCQYETSKRGIIYLCNENDSLIYGHTFFRRTIDTFSWHDLKQYHHRHLIADIDEYRRHLKYPDKSPIVWELCDTVKYNEPISWKRVNVRQTWYNVPVQNGRILSDYDLMESNSNSDIMDSSVSTVGTSTSTSSANANGNGSISNNNSIIHKDGNNDGSNNSSNNWTSFVKVKAGNKPQSSFENTFFDSKSYNASVNESNNNIWKSANENVNSVNMSNNNRNNSKNTSSFCNKMNIDGNDDDTSEEDDEYLDFLKKQKGNGNGNNGNDSVGRIFADSYIEENRQNNGGSMLRNSNEGNKGLSKKFKKYRRKSIIPEQFNNDAIDDDDEGDEGDEGDADEIANASNNDRVLCCSKHEESIRKFGYQCSKCECYLTEQEKIQYRKCVSLGEEYANRNEWQQVLEQFIKALTLCSSDHKLHLRCITIGEMLYGKS